MTKAGGGASAKGAFYRLMRDLHGYFSAVAFLALLFFAATGILLNHPNLLPGRGVPYDEQTVQLTPDQLAKVKSASEPGAALTEIVGAQVALAGRFEGGDISGQDLFVRLEGVRGASDLRGHLDTGEVEVSVSRQNAIQILNSLHRGETAGAVWKALIDILAAVLIIMSVMGYILFFSLRFRLKTALVLTGLSLVAMVGIFTLFTV